LIGLKFGRAHETDADEMSVVYLCGTEYNAAGAAAFFEKLSAGGGERPPEFLSTHPNPENRVANIHSRAKELRCRGRATNTDLYNQFKASLP